MAAKKFKAIFYMLDRSTIGVAEISHTITATSFASAHAKVQRIMDKAPELILVSIELA